MTILIHIIYLCDALDISCIYPVNLNVDPHITVQVLVYLVFVERKLDDKPRSINHVSLNRHHHNINIVKSLLRSDHRDFS